MNLFIEFSECNYINIYATFLSFNIKNFEISKFYF